MRALIVDDSKTIRLLLKDLMRLVGFEVFEAGHGREGLNCLRQIGPVDLALVDWNMPEMNGLDFVRAVRAEGAYDSIRLMMVTTETDMPRVVQALEAGANEYLMKPFTKDMILEKLDLMGLSRP